MCIRDSKSRAPFWKKEHLADGSEGGWVDAKESDLQSLARWNDNSSDNGT